MTKRESIQILCVLSVMALGLGLLTLRIVRADDGDYYNFDYEDYWEEYRKLSYPEGTRLPCNGTSPSTCTWAWEPWYQHGTDVPRMQAEQYTGRTISGYALMFQAYSSTDRNLHGGVFRRESVEPCHTYRFSMGSRAGLEPSNPAPTDSRMRVGISPTGDYPDQIVLTDGDINAIKWSGASNSKYAYEYLSVEATAESDTVTVYTRTDPDPNNQIYVFWDEGSFEEVPHTGDLVDVNGSLPSDMGPIDNVTVQQLGANSATITWNTGSIETLGQVLYRPLPEGTPPPGTYTYTVYLPLVAGQQTQSWSSSAVGDWNTNHAIVLTGLTSGMTYEYVVISYGDINNSCQTVATDPAREFQTP